MPFWEMVRGMEAECGVPAAQHRYWLLDNRDTGNWRPCVPLPSSRYGELLDQVRPACLVAGDRGDRRRRPPIAHRLEGTGGASLPDIGNDARPVFRRRSAAGPSMPRPARRPRSSLCIWRSCRRSRPGLRTISRTWPCCSLSGSSPGRPPSPTSRTWCVPATTRARSTTLRCNLALWLPLAVRVAPCLRGHPWRRHTSCNPGSSLSCHAARAHVGDRRRGGAGAPTAQGPARNVAAGGVRGGDGPVAADVPAAQRGGGGAAQGDGEAGQHQRQVRGRVHRPACLQGTGGDGRDVHRAQDQRVQRRGSGRGAGTEGSGGWERQLHRPPEWAMCGAAAGPHGSVVGCRPQ